MSKRDFTNLREIRKYVRAIMGLGERASVAADKLDDFNKAVKKLCVANSVQFEVRSISLLFAVNRGMR